ncbi:MAG: Rieske (2Fe-2S) protein [Candidatus Eremiobacteraeota bacterium]|nr:Rieske (2Fe-2S) protein [Candidatus Eremiobacteraeota bacterium]
MTFPERTVAGALCAAIVGAILFIVAYATGGGRLYEGLSAAFCAAALCAAAVAWARWLLPDETVIDERSEYPSSARDRGKEKHELTDAATTVTREKLLLRLLYAALGAIGVASLVPLRSLGVAPFAANPYTSKWRRGARLVRTDGSFVRINDLNVDSFLTVFPENALSDAMSQTILVRVGDDAAPEARGYMAYSKICTHAGCPVALYRAVAKQLMCPCHQSVFNVVDNGSVVSGPADHALPRLPLQVDGEGYVRAAGDFVGSVGPSYWQRSE